MKILVGITGASGTIYAQRLLNYLGQTEHSVDVVLSRYAPVVIREELRGGLQLPEGFRKFGATSMHVPFASGSSVPDVMIVVPCSMGAMGRIAHGYSDDALSRAADVVLKERKKLILVPRETPINLIHIRNFELIHLAGGQLIPANPSFYSGPESIEQLVDTVVSRILDNAGVQLDIMPRWQADPDDDPDFKDKFNIQTETGTEGMDEFKTEKAPDSAGANE